MSKSPSHTISKAGGFSIIELMIVIAIASVLAATALPALKDWQRNANRTAATTTLLSSLHLARSEAVKRNIRVSMCPSDKPTVTDAQCSGNKDFADGWIVFVDNDEDLEHSSDAKEEVLASVSAVNTAFTILTTKGETGLYYKPNGHMWTSDKNDTTDFNVCDDRGAEQGRVVSITKSGRPQSGITAADGTTPQC
jgi:type IV fimbrial biogenesis protein FimT